MQRVAEPTLAIGVPQIAAGCHGLQLELQTFLPPLRPQPPPIPLQGPDATPPLLQAARAGDAAAVEASLQAGSDANQRGSEGETALHWAADRGHEAVLSLLLRHGADVNAADSDGLTALHYAALAEQRGAAELLAAAPGVQLGLCSADGDTAADVAPAGWSFLQPGQ